MKAPEGEMKLEEFARTMLRAGWEQSLKTAAGMAGAGACLQHNAERLASQAARSLGQTGLQVARASVSAAGAAAPWLSAGQACRELENKLAVFEDFEHVEEKLGLPRQGRPDIEDWIRRARQQGSYRAVWMCEGLGSAYARRCWKGRPPQGLLNSGLPLPALVSLHVGMGLLFAERSLQRWQARSCWAKLPASLEHFLHLCRSNSRPGYLQAAFEPLGMASRLLFPWTVEPIGRHLAFLEPRLLDYFWHGVGRALYFAPAGAAPLPGWQDWNLQRCLAEAPDRTARLNLMAGLSWAMLLVNIRHPELLEGFLRRNRMHEELRSAFSQAAAAALMIWRLTAASPAEADRFADHQPSDPALRAQWKEWVAVPSQLAIRECEPWIQRFDCPGKLFRYRSLSRLSGQLAAGNGLKSDN